MPELLVTNCFDKLSDAVLEVGQLLVANQAVWVAAKPHYNTWTPENYSGV